jgi:hypothetical protein
MFPIVLESYFLSNSKLQNHNLTDKMESIVSPLLKIWLTGPAVPLLYWPAEIVRQ